MQIVVAHSGRHREVTLHLEDAHACVDDLVRAVDGDAAARGLGVTVAGRYFGPDCGLDETGLHQGAVVRLGRHPGEPAVPASGSDALAVVDGPCAGALVPLAGRSVTVGRDADCDVAIDDPSVSAAHARIDPQPDGRLLIHDLDSHNGTWVDGTAVSGATEIDEDRVVRLGATYLRVRRRLPDDRPMGADPLHAAEGGLVPFNRPPRPATPPELGAVETPEVPKPKQRNRALNLTMIVVPILMGATLAILLNPRFAIIAALSPVMAFGNWLSSRRQTKKDHVEATGAFKQALTELDAALAEQVATEVARREQQLPDLAETLRRVHAPSASLWQRRSEHEDFLRLRAGRGDVAWEPLIERGSQREADKTLVPRLDEVIDTHRTLPRCPVEVDLSDGGVVGLVGDRAAIEALARSLVVQAAAHHGPADVHALILAGPNHAAAWDWAKWLPHTRDAAGEQRHLAPDRDSAEQLVSARLPEPDEQHGRSRGRPHGPTLLVVVDDLALLQGRRAPTRRLLRGEGGPTAGIVLAETEDQLPAVTSTVVELRSDLGDATLRRPQRGDAVNDLVVDGLAEPTARATARALARYEDPEQELVGAGLPSSVRLLPLLDMDEVDAAAIITAWKEGLPDPAPNGPIGVGEDGPLHLDLVRDGPHGLVGGTTGSGKSELLRSLVAGMAARVDPEHLVFVLVDYKGGSAFEECAELPHTVGMVTDLDEHLGERALKSLEAELHHRERLLRDAGVQDLPAYLRDGARLGPLPRLVVVIDEFATMANELPDFLDALVGVAQRGRSLGVHLILATQRPSGAVNADIKTNTNLRIALRVQDDHDSRDIIDRPDAAALGRSTPGRAYVRLGPGDVQLVQTPLSTAASDDASAAALRLLAFPFAPSPPAPPRHEATEHTPTDLSRLVAGANQAFDQLGLPRPRKPWLPMLPEHLDLVDLPEPDEPGTIPLGLADEPAHQRRTLLAWRPADGHLALFGMVGSGTTTALRMVAASVAERHSPEEMQLYALDFGAGGLAPLSELPHVGAVVGANESERQQRLVRQLRTELDRRRGMDAAELVDLPTIVVLVDGIGAFLAEFEGAETMDLAATFRRVFSEGLAVRIVFAVTGARVGELPMKFASLVAQRLLLKLADPGDYTTAGLRGVKLPQFVPGRAVDAGSKLVVQLAYPGDHAGLTARAAELAARYAQGARPEPVRTLPTELALADLPADRSRRQGEAYHITLGVADDDLGPADLVLEPGDHALVAGAPRSGKSTLLATLARQLRRLDDDALMLAVCSERSPLRSAAEVVDGIGSLQGTARYLQAAVDDERRWLVLVDDAPRLDDPQGVLGRVVGSGRGGVHVIVAGRSDDFRRSLSHWTRPVRDARNGVLLQPDLTNDGDLLGTRLPRKVAVPLVVGRGFVVNLGDARLAQTATP